MTDIPLPVAGDSFGKRTVASVPYSIFSLTFGAICGTIYVAEVILLRRLLSLVIILVVTFSLFECNQTGNTRLEVFQAKYDGDSFEILSWNGNVYHVYGSVENNSKLIGDKFASVDTGNKNSEAVYAVNGYPTDQWVIHLTSRMMGAYSLYKEEKVTDIPEELEKEVSKYETESPAYPIQFFH